MPLLTRFFCRTEVRCGLFSSKSLDPGHRTSASIMASGKLARSSWISGVAKRVSPIPANEITNSFMGTILRRRPTGRGENAKAAAVEFYGKEPSCSNNSRANRVLLPKANNIVKPLDFSILREYDYWHSTEPGTVALQG